MKAYVEIRSQSPVGKWPKSGPDTYFAVQIVPDGVPRLKQLNQRVADVRDIKIKYFGQGYSNRTGPKSMYYQNLKAAEKFAKEFNESQKVLV